MKSSKLQFSTAGAIATEVAPTPMAHQAVHDTVVSILQDLPRGKLLDVPAGEGALAARLIEIGFDVHCCDLYPEIFQLQSVEVKRGDLDSALPSPTIRSITWPALKGSSTLRIRSRRCASLRACCARAGI